MDFIRKQVDVLKKPFTKGGKLEKLYPAFNAFETMLFVPDHTTSKGSHIRDGVDLKRTMITVIIALVPALFYGMYNTGYQYFIQTNIEFTFLDAVLHGAYKIFPMIAVSYAVGLAIEFAFAVYRNHPVNEGYLVTGLLIPMIMPIDMPLWMLAISVVFAVLIAKEAFGGTGMNILNPALTARAFAFFAYPAQLSGDKVWISEQPDGYSGATPLAEFAAGIEYNSNMFFSYFNGSMIGSCSETSTLAIIIGAFILLITGIGSWRTMISVFAGGLLMGLLFNLWGATEFMKLPAHVHLVLGGFAFGAVFMATDPVTAAQTNRGKLIVGFLIGVFAVLIRVFNPAYPEGMMLAILFANAFAPLIDYSVLQSHIKKRQSANE